MAQTKKKRKLSSILFPLIIIAAGACLFLYPFVSNYIYENRAAGTINTYEQAVEEADDSEIEALLLAAQEYNESLLESHVKLTDPFEETTTSPEGDSLNYYSILKQEGTDIMCYIDIPKINVYLPVYHGTSDEVLALGVGHLEGSSVPVGGESTHAVLSAHTGTNYAKMFTDLTEMEIGDHFYIHVLGETLAYEVDEISVVEPSDVSSLSIIEGEDHVTLVTCTPYGVNTHRLLVRGTRTEYIPEVEEEESPALLDSLQSQWMSEYLKAILAALAIVAAFAILSSIVGKWRKKHAEKKR